MMKRSKPSGAQGSKPRKEDDEKKAKHGGMYNDAIIIIKQS